MRKLVSVCIFLCWFITAFSQSFTSSNLPILKITTSSVIVDEPKVNGQIEVIYNGAGQRNNVTGDTPHILQNIGIEIRGQSSQFFDKKGYGFEFRDAAGDDLDLAFLSFPEESDFVLHGPYSDKSLIRNALAYTLAGSIMDYAPRVEMVEVMINNEYLGVYLLTERIKRGAGRVDVNRLKEDEISGDDLTGGYIVKIDKTDDNDAFWPSKYDPFSGETRKPLYVMHYPKAEDIQPQQLDYIKGVVTNFEDVMNSGTFANPTTGYPSMIDVQTFVDFFFINEISRNVDGYRISTYLYKDKDSNDGRLKAGPVWDFNLGFGNADYCDGWLTEGWSYRFNDICPQDGFSVPFWWVKLIESQTFKENTRDRWDLLRQGPLATDRILAVYDSLGTLLDEAQARNFQKFPVLGQYIWPNKQVSNTYAEELQWTRDWISSRLVWMDSQIGNFPSSISDTKFVSDFQIYPVPFEDELILDFIPQQSGLTVFTIYNALGQVVWRSQMSLIAGRHVRENLNMNIPQGYYVYDIRQKSSIIQSGKLIRK